MSERPENKKIPRPKVSFSQSEQKEEKAVKQPKENVTRQTERHNAPKIRSVVSFNKSVKILDPEKTPNDRVVPLNECKMDNSTRVGNAVSENVQDTSQTVTDVPKVQKISRHADDSQKNVKEGYNVSQLDKTLDNIVKNYTNLPQKKKNKNTSRKGKLQFVPRVTTNLRSQEIKNEIPRTVLTTMSLHSDCIPCHKVVAKNKIFPVKQSLRHTNDKTELSTIKQRSHLILPWEVNHCVKPKCKKTKSPPCQQHGRTFEHPECNSIMHVTEKLKKLEQQKIVTDINHLPPSLKSLINLKISTALDFKLDEAIYKNLVDLTIDKETLPPVVTRTKDPEPRQKDITPNLSDFFIPKDMKEHCEAVHVKLRPPKIDENWNAFKISSKILEWRYNLDDLDETL